MTRYSLPSNGFTFSAAMRQAEDAGKALLEETNKLESTYLENAKTQKVAVLSEKEIKDALRKNKTGTR